MNRDGDASPIDGRTAAEAAAADADPWQTADGPLGADRPTDRPTDAPYRAATLDALRRIYGTPEERARARGIIPTDEEPTDDPTP